MSFPSDDLPAEISACAQAILSHTDAALEDAAKWEEPPPKESKYADALVQEPQPQKYLQTQKTGSAQIVV